MTFLNKKLSVITSSKRPVFTRILTQNNCCAPNANLFCCHRHRPLLRVRGAGVAATWRLRRGLDLAGLGVRAADRLLESRVSGRCGRVTPEARSGPRRVGRAAAVIGRRCPAPRGTGEVTSRLRAECVYDSFVGSRAVWLWRIHPGGRFRRCEAVDGAAE